MDGIPVGAGKPEPNTQVPAAPSARHEDSEYPERDQLVIRGGQEEQHAAEKGGWLLGSQASCQALGFLHSLSALRHILNFTK